MNMQVRKRNGELEPIDYEKINKVLMWATEDINGVSASDVAMHAKLKWEDKMETKAIHEALISTAADMISEDKPNYQYVAANLLNYYIRKEVFGAIDNLPPLYDVIKKNVEIGVYTPDLLTAYSKEDIDNIDKFVKHRRDNDFTYAGLQQLVDKYLQKNRLTGELYETPQYMYVLIAMTLFIDETDQKVRIKEVRNFYDQISKHKISLPTPIMAGVRTTLNQFSSCTLIDVGDSIDSIFTSTQAIGEYTAKRAGIGINSRIRALNDKIRNGEVVHTGVIPFFKVFEATVKSSQQAGLRGGSATLYFPFWHLEVEDVIMLKNNQGTEDNRVRKLDYAIQFSKIFYKRFAKNENITLFSPKETEDMYKAFGVDNEEFDRLYLQYEKDPNVRKKQISAREFMAEFTHQRIETGRIYLMNIDNANTYSSFLNKVSMSNLCTEINLVTSPMNHIDDGKEVPKYIVINDKDKFQSYKEKHGGLYINGGDQSKLVHDNNNKGFQFWSPDYDGGGEVQVEDFELQFGDEPAEIALCVLAAVNCGKVKDLSDLEGIMYYIVHALDKVIDKQDYPIHAAKKMLKRRSIGIGLTNFAYYLAKRGLSYEDPQALEVTHEFMEAFQYYAIKASVELAKKYGPCEWFNRTKYAKGILPVDNYNKNVDKLVEPNYKLDWHALREDVLKYGMRNSTLSAIMPCESSSLVTNSTNGIEPPRDTITIKLSKTRPLKMVLPEVKKLKNKYTYAYEMKDNYGYLNICSVIGKFIDQGISANQYYNVNNYEDGQIPIQDMVKEIAHFYKYGGKQLYYSNTYDGKTDEFEITTSDCVGGACSI